MKTRIKIYRFELVVGFILPSLIALGVLGLIGYRLTPSTDFIPQFLKRLFDPMTVSVVVSQVMIIIVHVLLRKPLGVLALFLNICYWCGYIVLAVLAYLWFPGESWILVTGVVLTTLIILILLQHIRAARKANALPH